MRGTKPKPTKLKILEGAQPCRINRSAPEALPGLPEPPEFLDDVGRAAWDRMVRLWDEMGALSRSDGEALTLYCTTFSRWRSAMAKVAEHGLVGQTAAGGYKASPYVGVAERCEAQLIRLLAEFGGTPSSRSRVHTSEGGPKDSLDEFMAKRKA
jgi:P27 family predicted phage terminase small subunit